MTRLDQRALLRERARVVAWGVAIASAVAGAGAYLAQNHTGAVIAQVVIAEFGTGRLGVTWSDALAPIPTGAMIARRVARGASLGAAAAVVLLGVAVITRVAELHAGTIGIAPIIVGLLMSAGIGARDELLLRGLVLRAIGPKAFTAERLIACALAGAAWRFGTGTSVAWTSLVFAALTSVALATLWLRDRGAWLPVAANATFMFVTGPLAHGALLDVRTGGDLDASYAAVACAAVFAGSGIASTMRS